MPKRKASENEADSFSADEASSSAAESEGGPSSSSKQTRSRKEDANGPHRKKTKVKSKEEANNNTATNSSDPKHKIQKNAEGDSFLDLGKKKRATVRTFKGMTLLDIREYYGTEGEEKPGKKGISLTLEQWQFLRNASGAIDGLFAEQKQK